MDGPKKENDMNMVPINAIRQEIEERITEFAKRFEQQNATLQSKFSGELNQNRTLILEILEEGLNQ